MSRRPSAQTLAVLAELAAGQSEWRHGYELGHQLGLKAGSLYPILMRLCDRGALEATGRPTRLADVRDGTCTGSSPRAIACWTTRQHPQSRPGRRAHGSPSAPRGWPGEH